MKKNHPQAWTDDHRAGVKKLESLACHQSIFRTKGQKILQTEDTININAIIKKTTEEADTSCSPLHSGKEGTVLRSRSKGLLGEGREVTDCTIESKSVVQEGLKGTDT